MKKFMKLGAVVLAIVMVLSMSVTAFAETPTAVWTTTFTDTFKAAESDNAQNLPAATFHYSITAGAAVAGTAESPMIQAPADGNGLVVDDNAAITKPIISDAVHAQTGAGVLSSNATVTIDFTGVTFTRGGIFRYVITETGVTSSVGDDITIDTAQTEAQRKGTYYLDVYVNNSNGSFVPTAYAMHTGSEPTINDPGAGHDTVDIQYTAKIQTITNEYETYDLTVQKVITGNVVYSSFVFTIDIENIPEGVILKQDTQSSTAPATSETNATQFTAQLGNNEQTVIKGIPSTAKFKVSEAVDHLLGYQSSATLNGSADSTNFDWLDNAGAQADANAAVSAQKFGMFAAMDNDQTDNTIVFTNDLMYISPTGVILRVAPYALMLGVGLFLVLFMRRRKNQAEA